MEDKEESLNPEKNLPSNHLTRKEMILKTGRYAAFTAAAMMTILKSASAQPTNPNSPIPGD
jgi:hypothetical protein